MLDMTEGMCYIRYIVCMLHTSNRSLTTRRKDMSKSHRNPMYHIRRENMLKALGLPERIPLGETMTWENVKVVTGDWCEKWGEDHPARMNSGEVVLPFVQLVEKGVANRIQVKCPEYGQMMRFSGLQQHVGSKTCEQKRNSKDPQPEVMSETVHGCGTGMHGEELLEAVL
jgi:hypothetical protein